MRLPRRLQSVLTDLVGGGSSEGFCLSQGVGSRRITTFSDASYMRRDGPDLARDSAPLSRLNCYVLHSMFTT